MRGWFFPRRVLLRVVLAALLVLLATCAQPLRPDDFDRFAFAQAVGPGFVFGAATSSHQVEGSNTNDWTAWETGAYDDGRSHIVDQNVSSIRTFRVSLVTRGINGRPISRCSKRCASTPIV